VDTVSWWRPCLLRHGSSLGSNPDNSQKYKMGDISKGVANTTPARKKYTKTNLLRSLLAAFLKSCRNCFLQISLNLSFYVVFFTKISVYKILVSKIYLLLMFQRNAIPTSKKALALNCIFIRKRKASRETTCFSPKCGRVKTEI
jgi:hypothetical protein